MGLVVVVGVLIVDDKNKLRIKHRVCLNNKKCRKQDSKSWDPWPRNEYVQVYIRIEQYDTLVYVF